MADITHTFLTGKGLDKLFRDMRDGTFAEQVAATSVHMRGMDFYTAVGFGLLSPEIRRVTALGNNPDVDTASIPEDVWPNGGLYPFMTGATSLEIVSTSAADAAAGTGARTVLVSGLDVNYVEQSDLMTLNGTTPVAIPKQYLRVNQMLVMSAGTGEVNAGAVSVRDSGGGTVRSVIPIGFSISRQAVYTVPAGHTLSIHSLFSSINRTSGIDKNITIGFVFRSSAGVRRTTLEFSISSVTPYRHDGIPGIILTEKTDVTLRITASATSDVDVTAAFLGLLVANTAL